MNLSPWFLAILRVIAMAVVFWLLLLALGLVVRIAPGWSPGLLAIVFALLAEILIRLYRYESSTLGRKRSRQVVSLRLAALALLAWILMEPTLVRSVKRKLNREVAVLWDQSASMDLIDDGETRSRADISRDAVKKSGIFKKLGDQVRIREIQFARSPESEAGSSGVGWNMATDIAAALDTVLEQVSPDELAGAIVLTDGRHNRPSRVEESSRRFGTLDAPLGIVAVGSPAPPRDASILSVRSPDAIHLGDRVKVSADVKFDGYKGSQAKVSLICEGKKIEEKTITIPEDRYREEVKFVHLAEEGGTGTYQIEIDPLVGERFQDNNDWSFETSITEARTNVLLMDSYPRWEFRYLRNLFYGRDKSIHLQWMLLNPDHVEGQALLDVAASATRPFGEAYATRLPENEAEWRKFDVIILGDLPAAAISDDTWAIISRCVNERGALLVFIAGPSHMPHALGASQARELLPLDPGWSNRTFFGQTEKPFRLSLTAEGRNHPITRHADGSLSNQQTWSQFPTLQWRHPVKSVKEGADILLVAAGDDEADRNTLPDDSADLDTALEDLARRREKESQNALLVTRQTGRGKVAAIMTDRTWRLREGAGDVHHHRFWGNLVRWGAGPLLRAGNEKIALGSDQITYTTDDPITITARLRDDNLNPAPDPTLRAEILSDGKVVATVPLVAQEGSNGLHEGKLKSLKTPGLFQVRLVGKKAPDGKVDLSTNFRVVGTKGQVELADTTLDQSLLDAAAAASGGKVVKPDEMASLLPLFITEGANRTEIRETPLWDNFFIFTALALILTIEWWLRRKTGLP